MDELTMKELKKTYKISENEKEIERLIELIKRCAVFVESAADMGSIKAMLLIKELQEELCTDKL